MDLGSLTQRLADLHISTIVWFVAVLTVARIVFLRFQAPAARVVVEIAEAALIAAVLVFLLIQPFVVKAFYIPSGSMIPTLIEDDHILVNRFGYRFAQPHHGDVIVFAAPPRALEVADEPPAPNGDPIDYIKRLIGLPGDTIQVFHGYVKIGDRTYTHGDIADYFGLTDENHEHVKFEANDIRIFDGAKWTAYSPDQIAEKVVSYPTHVEIHPGYVVRNGVRLDEPYIAEDPDYDLKIVDGHSLLAEPGGPGSQYKLDGDDLSPDQYEAYAKQPAGPVPAGDVYAMGDNRNESSDSTHWGPLAENRLVGRAIFIFYPFDRIRVLH